MDIQSSRLPETAASYCVRNGEGEQYRFGSQVATILATNKSTVGQFDLVVLTGAKDDAFPLHTHSVHEAIYVLEGKLELTLDEKRYLLTAGDFASIPSEVVHGYQMKSHKTRLISITLKGKVSPLYQLIGEPYPYPVRPNTAQNGPTQEQYEQAMEVADFRFVSDYLEGQEAQLVENGVLPDKAETFVLAASEGKRMLLGDQLHTLLMTKETANNAFICATAEGPVGLKVIDHFHYGISETFFCLQGRATVWGDGVEYSLLPGDLVHVPARGVHSYRLDTNDARFFSVITPGDFEAFFTTVGDPYEHHVYPNIPEEFHADRLIANAAALDIHIAGSASGTRDEVKE